VAVENGVDSIEHGAEPTEEILALMREKKAFQVLTISPALPFAEFDREVMHITPVMQENGKIVFNGVIAMANACLNESIPVGLGTDTACPYVTQYDMWRELYYYVKYCGVTPAFALYSGTLLNATLAGIGNITGSIEPGKSADMIVVEKNPLEDLTTLRDVKMVFMEGTKHLPKLKKLPQVEQKLDEYI
jgi:imidazolonepropionase-like amidohydrolase